MSFSMQSLLSSTQCKFVTENTNIQSILYSPIGYIELDNYTIGGNELYVCQYRTNDSMNM